MDKKKIWESYRFPLILLGGIILGAILGAILGEKATVLAPIGNVFINLLFMVVVPMVFVSIVNAVGSMLNMNRLGKILGSLIGVFIVTGLIASVLVLVVVNVFPPAANTTIEMTSGEMGEMASVGDMIVSTLTVDDFSGLMSRKNMLPIIVAAIFTGLAVAKCGGQESPFGKVMCNLNDIIMKIVDMIMKFAPLGLGAYFANLVGEFGPQLIGDYGRCMLIYYPMCIVYGVVFFPLYAYFAGGKKGVKAMAKNIFNPAITAFATQSSCATIPVNQEACDKMGVPQDISNIVLPMGATMHMDGSVLSAITKIAFLYGVFNMQFTGVGTYAMAIAVAVLSAFVLSGAAKWFCHDRLVSRGRIGRWGKGNSACFSGTENSCGGRELPVKSPGYPSGLYRRCGSCWGLGDETYRGIWGRSHPGIRGRAFCRRIPHPDGGVG